MSNSVRFRFPARPPRGLAARGPWFFGALAAVLAVGAPAAAAQELCADRFSVDVAGERLSLPICTSHPFDRADPSIERIVFSIHGVGTNAETYYESMVSAADRVPGSRGRTLILAPQLMTTAYAETVPIGSADLFWATSSGRFWGAESASTDDHPRSAAISSFTLMDRLLEHLTEPGRFPNLRTIVVAGHSGGGQFTNRYAAASVLDHQALESRGIRIRYIVSNPSTYVYLTNQRAVPGVLTRDQFAAPGADVAQSCGAFDRYGSGLDIAADDWPYLARVGAERIREQYGRREVIYLMGMYDNDPQGAALARGCAAMLQGDHRLERGITYFNHIDAFYAERGGHRHRISFVPRVAHDHAGIWASDEGVLHIFDYWPHGGGN